MVNPELFRVKVEQFNPFSKDYKDFWKVIKRRIIEGYWVSGKYMPPQLYYFINHHHIKLNKLRPDGTFSTNKTIGLPFLQDTDWIRAYTFLEARGFSGFELDDEFHCISETKKKYGVVIPENKTYVHPREYLQKQHKKNLGKPLYQNQAYNVFDLEARESGKSMIASAFIAHNYLTDGITDYDEYLSDINQVFTSESVISSIDQKYSDDLAAKVKIGLDFLEGGQTYNGIYYPSPLFKISSGSLSKKLVASKEINKDGVKKVVGSGSTIHVITFGSDEFAGNGKRPSVMVVDEVGFAFTLKQILANMKDATYANSDKFGTIWMTGTGGEMEAANINNIKDVFYNPEIYDCLVFNDEWENKGKCGLFFPKYMTVRDFKDENGNTKIEQSKAKWEKDYNKALESKDQTIINKFLINSPGCPSHAFLTKEGNKFQTKLIEERINKVKSTTELLHSATKGFFRMVNGTVVFETEAVLNKNLFDVPFPYSKGKDNPLGCGLMYESPSEIEPYKYIAGLDPVAHDVGDSLPSFYIYKRITANDYDEKLVYSYTGRGDKTTWHNEQVRLALIYYGAKVMTENQVNNVKEHFDTNKCLSLLANRPDWMAATVNKNRQYGVNMTVDIRLELEDLLYNFLEEPHPLGGIQIDYINDVQLLEELKAYDGIVNTDRADAFMFTILYRQGLRKKKIEEKKHSDFYNFFNRKLMVDNQVKTQYF